MRAIALAWRVSKPWMRITAIFILAIAVMQLYGLVDQIVNPRPPAPAIEVAAPVAAPHANAQQSEDHIAAKMMCQTFVRKKLVAPSTAKFEPVSQTAAAPSQADGFVGMKNSWDVTGYVDAQNSFGAMLRNEYFCTMTKTDPDKWRAHDVSITQPR
jgi:hypothetical protein